MERGTIVLSEERFSCILSILEEKHTVSVQELSAQLSTSESTIRRDLVKLDQQGKLRKLHGGAASLTPLYSTKDDSLTVRLGRNIEEKQRIAQYAASLVVPGDFIYIDAGTTTELIGKYLTAHNIGIVTNSTIIAHSLTRAGYPVTMVGGEIKPLTEALVGPIAISNLAPFNFTKGFFGTNGIHPKHGYTTPEMNEASMKTHAMAQCRERYVLADTSKFNIVSPVTFGELSAAAIITGSLPDPVFREHTTVLEVGKP